MFINVFLYVYRNEILERKKKLEFNLLSLLAGINIEKKYVYHCFFRVHRKKRKKAIE